jgi:3-phosphoshikimate 1-carboxyvinyltransferase
MTKSENIEAAGLQAVVRPSSLHGSITAAASKSSMQRACAAALLCHTDCILYNPGHSNDDLAALGVIKSLGAQVEAWEDGSLHISSRGVRPVTDTIHCGESGLGVRMFTPIAALSERPLTLTGEGSLTRRPMDFFDQVLPALGVEVHSQQGRLPLRLKGPLRPMNITVDGSLSSQFLTGLLMAFSASGAKDVTIRAVHLKSLPYIDLTLKIMQDFGMLVPVNRSYQEFHFTGEPEKTPGSPISYTVEGDWSGASFLLVAGAIAGELELMGLELDSTQADRKMLEALALAKAPMVLDRDKIRIGPGHLDAFEFDATDCPDLFPPLAALAAYCYGTTVIKGTSRLTHKESNRALTLQEEFGKMQIEINLEGDHMYIKGGSAVKGAAVHSRHDHRIAMACAVAALRADGETCIASADAVDKSYPDFFAHLQALGARIQYGKALSRP